MKLILLSLLLFGLTTPLRAADPVKGKDAAKAEAKSKAPKPPKEPTAEDQALAASLSAAQKTKLMSILNTGDDKALGALPGVGLVRGTAIKAKRPLAGPLDLLKVPGVGSATFKQVINHAKADFPTPAPKAKAPSKKKSAAKKGEEGEKK